MSGDGNFITRWSRLKQRAADEDKKAPTGSEAEGRRPPHADAEQTTEAKDGPGEVPARSVGPGPPFDPATLPPIESIVAGTDIRAFLQKGVPAALTKAALRRAWTADPAIRDFIEVAENQWDFTDPTAIPGFGPLQATDNLRQLVGQALGNLPETPEVPEAASSLQESRKAMASAKAAGDGAWPEDPATPMQVVEQRDAPDNPDTARVAALQHPEPALEVGNAPRRKGHGGAMPR
jgi:uncharacterized protein DUF3306